MRDLIGQTKRLLGLGQIVKFDQALPAARPRKPLLRIVVSRLIKDGHGFLASPVLVEAKCNLNVRSREIQRNRIVVRSNLIRHVNREHSHSQESSCEPGGKRRENLCPPAT